VSEVTASSQGVELDKRWQMNLVAQGKE